MAPDAAPKLPPAVANLLDAELAPHQRELRAQVEKCIGAAGNTKRDNAVLRRMLASLDTAGVEAPGAIRQALATVLREQFSLQPSTRSALAQGLTMPHAPGEVRYGPDGPPQMAVGRALVEMLVSLASIKAVSELKAEQASEVEVAQLQALWASLTAPPKGTNEQDLRARLPQLQQAHRVRAQLDAARALPRPSAAGPGSQLRAAMADVDQVEAAGREARRAQQAERHWLARNLGLPGFAFARHAVDGLARFREVLPTHDTAGPPPALYYGQLPSVQLDHCVRFFEPSTLLPRQLRAKLFFLRDERLVAAERVGPLAQRIDWAEREVLAYGDIEVATEKMIAQVDAYRSLGRELDELVSAPSATQRRRQARPAPHALPSPTPGRGLGLAPVAPPSPPPAEPVRPPAVTPPRTVVVGPATRSLCFGDRGWQLLTRLDDRALGRLLRREVDPGTFPDVYLSAAYHLHKHAPWMLVEDYLAEARRTLDRHWVGEVARRLPRAGDHAQADRGDDALVKVVRSHEGQGRYSWRGQVLWFAPAPAFSPG